jgi:hypothetical protein
MIYKLIFREGFCVSVARLPGSKASAKTRFAKSFGGNFNQAKGSGKCYSPAGKIFYS